MKTVVKLKRILAVHMDGTVDTEDKRYNLKCPLKKIVKFCLKNEIPFRVGIRGNKILRDHYNYIETYDNSFVRWRLYGEDTFNGKLKTNILLFLTKYQVKKK